MEKTSVKSTELVLRLYRGCFHKLFFEWKQMWQKTWLSTLWYLDMDLKHTITPNPKINVCSSFTSLKCQSYAKCVTNCNKKFDRRCQKNMFQEINQGPTFIHQNSLFVKFMLLRFCVKNNSQFTTLNNV